MRKIDGKIYRNRNLTLVVFAFILFAFITLPMETTAQKIRMNQDPKLNNLVHPPGYKTAKLGELGRVTKVGDGTRDMILIAGSGFGGDIWDEFMNSRKEQYTMYAVTLAGFGGTDAPPMPPEGTSYGEQTWTKSAQKGIEKLIEEKKLKKPIIIAHWATATQIATGLALEKPEQVSRVIIVSGIPKNVFADAQFGKRLTPKEHASYVDTGMAPRWFKTVTRDTWDDNNWYPYDYAIHPVRAMQLWRMAFEPTLPTHVRYLCENWANDSTVGLDNLKVPMLVLKPEPGKDFDSIPGQRGSLRTVTHDSWKGVEKMNVLIRVETIENSRAFIMDDQPKKLDEVIAKFLSVEK